MPNKPKTNLKRRPPPAVAPRKGLAVAGVIAAVVVLAAVVAVIAVRTRRGHQALPKAAGSASATNAPNVAQGIPAMPINQAVMVTVELDFGPKVPSIAEGLREIERRYTPDDGQGRTFAILDAYGEPTPDNKLHMSMHVSSEKPGRGWLVFKRTGEVLWQGKINPTSQPIQPKNLTVLMDNGKGTSLTVEGSENPNSIIDAKVKPGDLPVREIWTDGQERDFTFI